MDLEKGISEWRESRAREREPPGTGPHREFLRATGGPQRNSGRTPPRPAARHAWPIAEDEADRTQALIDRGRRTAPPPHRPRRASSKAKTSTKAKTSKRAKKAKKGKGGKGGRIALGSAAALVAVVVGAMILLRKGPSWPPSVATVQSEITTACQNPNVVSEPGQVDFACGKDTSQILWVFALLTSNNNPGYLDAKTGRKGLEPITPAQGGQIAWSLNLHHPYDPVNPVDSLAVAARAINNIIGGATLTGTNGSPTVQPGLESQPDNCARYTGSSAIVSHPGFPSLCAAPVTSAAGQAALVADVYQQWMVGSGPVAAQNASVLFENASNPGDPQVQAILKSLPNSGR